ncbi:MAG: gliding motility protein GldM [Flavobacteriales bacterium]|nr:gliding motility protein GldM [Flavobacteriales bacterium]
MSGAKETPRQKMIGMMYLVLTALLALNISKEVLDGFVKVENSLLQTQSTLSSKISDTYSALEGKYSSNQVKVGPFYDQAQAIVKKSDDLVRYITELKARCLSTSSGDFEQQELVNFENYIGVDENGNDTTLNLAYIRVKDEYQSLTRYMVGADEKNPIEGEWTANGIRLAVQEYRDYLLNMSVTDIDGNVISLPANTIKSLNERFSFEQEMKADKMVSWEIANFHKMPLAAVMPLMSKMIIDIRDAEEDAIGWLLNSTEAKSLKFSNIMPLTIPQSNYILRGDTVRANIFLAAFDPTKKPEVYIDSKKWDGKDSTALDYADLEPLDVNDLGQGVMAMSSRGMSLGQYQYKGVIRYQGAEGEMQSQQFFTPSFTIAEPALVVSPTKMNVFYRGVPNPVEISVPGVPSDKLRVSISGSHKIKKQSDGTYIVEPSTDSNKTAVISVKGEMPDGTISNLGQRDFVVKRIPDPLPWWGGKDPTNMLIKTNEILSFTAVVPKMPDFAFQIKPEVIGFTITMSKDGVVSSEKSTNNKITSQQEKLLRKARPGTRLFFEDIKVRMPDKTTRILNLSLKVIK